LVIPAIQIAPLENLEPLDTAIRTLTAYDWLIFTSANAVAVFAAQLAARGQPATILQGVKVAVIGPATAQAVRELGAEPALAPPEYVAESLVDSVGDIAGQRVLLPQAAGARPMLAERLQQRGAQVQAIPVYETLPAAIDEVQLAELRRGVDAILFTSGSTVRALTEAVQADPISRQQLDNTLIVCIGPVTAQVAHDLGLPVGLVAEEHTTDGLVQALVDHFQGASHGNDNRQTENC
jgi:uroporphyrinogen-III synthase